MGCGDVLIAVPAAQLVRVQGKLQQTLDSGSFSLSTLERPGQESEVVAQVGDTRWTIAPDSATLRAGELTFLFALASEAAPTTTQQQQQQRRQPAFYSVTLAANTPGEAVGVIEALLEAVSLMRESQRLLDDAKAQAGEAALAEAVAYRHSTARGISKASAGLASGILASAAWASSAISAASKRWRGGEPTQEPVQLSEGFKKRVAHTAALAKWVARGAKAVVGGIAWVVAQAARPLTWALGLDRPPEGEDAGRVRESAHAAASGFVEVWDSMEQAAYVVLTSSRDSAAAVMGHRYGADAAQVTKDGLNAATYTADAALSVRKIGPKAVAKAAAKQTAKSILAGNRPGPVTAAAVKPGSK